MRVTSSPVANHDDTHLGAEDDETVAGTTWSLFAPEPRAGTRPATMRNNTINDDDYHSPF